jgi:hypothetical protein
MRFGMASAVYAGPYPPYRSSAIMLSITRLVSVLACITVVFFALTARSTAAPLISLPTEFSGDPSDNAALDGLLGASQFATSTIISTGSGQAPDRDDPAAAFGEPGTDFYEIGFREVTVWGFESLVDLAYVTLFTGEDSAEEVARVLGGTTTESFFTFIGDVTSDQALGGYSFLVDLGEIDAIMVQDLSSGAPISIDVRGIKLTSVQHAVPTPATLALIGLGLVGVASRRPKQA